MMKTQRTGTLSPKKDAGGTMRRGVLALVVLLLACVLMAGAVSAEDSSTNTITTWDALKTALKDGGSVTLTQNINDANSQLILNGSKDATLSLNGHTITGSFDDTLIVIGDKGSSDEKKGVLKITGQGTIVNSKGTIRVYHGNLDIASGVNISSTSDSAINIHGNKTDTADYSVVNISQGAVIDGCDIGIWISQYGKEDNTDHNVAYGIVLNVDGTVKTTPTDSYKSSSGSMGIYINGLVKATDDNIPKITIGQNAIISGTRGLKTTSESGKDLINENAGPAVYAAGVAEWIINGGTFTGDEALSIKSGNFTISGGEFNGNGVYRAPPTSWGNGSEATGAAVSLSANNGYAQKVNIQITGGTFKSVNQSAFFEGSGTDHSGTGLASLSISDAEFKTDNASLSPVIVHGSGLVTGGVSIKDTSDGNNLLYRGVNLTSANDDYNAKWIGDASNGYTLAISKSGSYKLMDDFTTTGTGIQITADGVTLDGNDKQITGMGTMKGYILKVKTESSSGSTGITLDNLNIITGNGASGLTGNYGFLTLYNKTILKNSKLNFSGFTTTSGTMVPGVYVTGGTAKETQLIGNTITGGNLGGGDSQARVIVIDGADDVLIKGNTLTMGTAIVNTDKKESYGVQIKAAGTKNTMVIDNTINAGENNKANYKGIDIITVGDYGNHTITGNTFTLHKAENNSVIQITASSSTPVGGGFLNLTITGNKFAQSSGAGYGIYAKANSGLKNLTLLGTIKNNDFNKAENLFKNILGTNEFINLTNSADWGAAAKTIEVTGNTSIENKTENRETLTAKFNDGSSAAFNWAIKTGDEIIAFEGSTAGSSVTYKPLKVGNATITVSSGTVTKDVVITVYAVTAPTIDTKVEKKDDGKVNISVDDGGKSTITVETGTGETPTKTTITDPTTETTLVLTYAEPATVQKDGTGKVESVEGKVAEVVASYPETEAPASKEANIAVTYALELTLDPEKALNGPVILPKINPAFNETIAEKVKTAHNGYLPVAMITAEAPAGSTLEDINNNLTGDQSIKLTFTMSKSMVEAKGGTDNVYVIHVEGDVVKETLTTTYVLEGDNYVFTAYGKKFSFYVSVINTYTPPITPVPTYQPVYSSGDGNMENSFRVLFDTIGGSFISPVTYLSYGDKISQPPAPTKDGYTFGGWYKDSACTQGWSFSEGIPGDMTLYAKWIPSSGGQSSSSQQTVSQTGSATAQQTTKATPAATQAQSTSAATAAVSGTAASGVSPTMTQAPAPVFGALLGLLAAGVLLRRRD